MASTTRGADQRAAGGQRRAGAGNPPATATGINMDAAQFQALLLAV